jgi:DedD protein
LKRAGYAAYTEPLKTSKGTLWRVRVGPYGSREAAIAARDKLKAEGQSGIVAAVK